MSVVYIFPYLDLFLLPQTKFCWMILWYLLPLYFNSQLNGFWMGRSLRNFHFFLLSFLFQFSPPFLSISHLFFVPPVFFLNLDNWSPQAYKWRDRADISISILYIHTCWFREYGRKFIYPCVQVTKGLARGSTQHLWTSSGLQKAQG